MSDLSPSSAGLFERLEQSMVDPHVKGKMELARLYEELLNDSEFTQEDLINYVGDLDKGWAFMGALLKVTGTIWYGAPGVALMQARRVEQATVVSQGFSFDHDKIIFDDEYIAGYRHASLQFSLDDEVFGAGNTVGLMHLEDVEDIEYPFASNELRVQRFPINYPDLAEDIDEAIMNATDDNDKIARFRDFTLKIDFSKPDEAELLVDAQAYIDRIMSFDRDLPFYYLQVLGKLGLMKDEEGIVVSEAQHQFRRVATVNRISLHPDDLYETAGDTHTFIPCLDATIHGKQAGDSPQDVIVPFTSVIWAESIRTAP